MSQVLLWKIKSPGRFSTQRTPHRVLDLFSCLLIYFLLKSKKENLTHLNFANYLVKLCFHTEFWEDSSYFSFCRLSEHSCYIFLLICQLRRNNNIMIFCNWINKVKNSNEKRQSFWLSLWLFASHLNAIVTGRQN